MKELSICTNTNTWHHSHGSTILEATCDVIRSCCNVRGIHQPILYCLNIRHNHISFYVSACQRTIHTCIECVGLQALSSMIICFFAVDRTTLQHTCDDTFAVTSYLKWWGISALVVSTWWPKYVTFDHFPSLVVFFLSLPTESAYLMCMRFHVGVAAACDHFWTFWPL